MLSYYNLLQRTLPIYTIGPKTHVLVCFFPFGCFLDRFATARNLVQLIQMFMPQCRAKIFRNERSQSTPLDRKHMFWCVFFCVGAFGTILLLHETYCETHQTGTINAKVRAMMSC